MRKRILSLMLALLVIAGTCFTAIPSLNASAKFKTGDTIVITEKAGGGVFPQGVVGENYPEYDVSAMGAQNKTGTESYYAWCASYGVHTPDPGREYVLYGFKENQKTVTVNNQIICRVNPTTGHYEYLDTGLGGYIDFNWALSCIKAAEFYAKTSQLSPAWRMVVELAVRERFFPGLAEGTIDIDKTLAVFGTGVRDYLISLCGNDELILTPGDPSGNGVENFFEKVQSVIVYAEDHPVIWTPYAEEIKVEKTAEEEYRGDDFIFFEGTVNKYGCTLNYDVSHPAYMSVTLKGNVLTVKMPRNKMVNGTRYTWNAELMLPAGLNYNMMYGVPKTVDPNNAVQNIMVYEVDNKSLSWGDRGEHTPHETADILVKKTDETGKVMSNVEFTLYEVLSSGGIQKLNHEEYSSTQSTDSSGQVVWRRLSLGKYFLVESGKPEGYSDPQWRIQWTVKDGDSEKNTAASSVTTATYNGIEGIVIELIAGTVKASVGVINEQETSKIIIDKAVTDNSNPAGFKFTLYPVKANGTLGAGVQQTTGQPGTASFLDLPFGTYFLVENYAGTGYAPYKQEEWGISGALSAQFTTINGMKGWKIELGKTQVWVYANNYKPDHHITIEKVDTEGNPLAGVPFEVRKFINGEEDGLALLLTDANGKVSMSNIGVGEYLIVERAPKGQAPYNPAQWVVTGAKSATYTTMDGATGWYIVLDQDHPSATIKAVNKTQTGSIAIIKTTSESILAGDVFKFRITSDNSPAYDQTFTLPVFLGDEMAFISVHNLPIFKSDGSFITYTIEEVEAPKRYIKSGPRTVCFEDMYNANNTKLTYSFDVMVHNELLTQDLYIEKTSYNNIVEGIKFQLVSDYGTYEGVTVKDTDEDIGRVEFLDLPVYDENDNVITYTLKETINGSYRFSPSPIFTSEDTVLNTNAWSHGETKFNLLDGNAHISVFNTQPPFEIGITKQSDFGEREGFTFILTSSLGDRWESVTDEYGEAYFGLLDTYDSNLNPIIYTLTELETDVYKPMEPIIIDASQITNGLYVLNRFNPLKDGLIRILKSAEDGAIEGVEFEITSSLGETWTVLTDKYGVAELSGLDVYENGEYIEYTITEVNVPIRYQEHQLAWTLTFEEQVSTATILDECFIQSISVENELKTSDLLVRKTSDDGVIEGFTFSVTASNGGSYEITTDSSGQGVLMNLPIYDVNNNLIVYTINEVFPPEMVQYVLPAPVEVTLLYEDLVVVEMHNAFKRITLDITKINDKGDVLAGAKFALLYSTDEGGTWLPLTTDIVNFASDQHVEGNIFVSDKNGKIVIENLYAHYHYKVTEIKAPDGYMLSSSPWIVAPDLIDIEDTKTFENTATNYPQPTLPPTGDAGFGYISIAVLVMCLAGWLGFSKRKKVLN